MSLPLVFETFVTARQLKRKTLFLICDTVLNFDPIHLFKHRFCGDHKEDDRAKAVDEIHGESGYVAGEDGLPFKCFTRHHHSGGGIHNATIDNDCRECTEHGKGRSRAAEPTLFEQNTSKKADDNSISVSPF